MTTEVRHSRHITLCGRRVFDLVDEKRAHVKRQPRECAHPCVAYDESPSSSYATGCHICHYLSELRCVEHRYRNSTADSAFMAMQLGITPGPWVVTLSP